MVFARSLILPFVIVCTSFLATAQSQIRATDARNHINEKQTVCGEVVSTHYAPRSRGNPTFLNFDKPYPEQVFTVVIWGSDRPKFSQPEVAYHNKHICVTGQIKEFRGVPEIVAYDPSQITLR